jgi:shikimate kinase
MSLRFPAGQLDRQRDAGRVDEKVVLGARPLTIDRGWPRQEPAKSARTWLPSTATRDQSIAPAGLSFLSSSSCRMSLGRDATPALRHVALVGLMAVGKTTIGRLLATSLRRQMSDSDSEIRAQEGITARGMQERDGADALHALEASLLLAVLARAEPSIVCAAASTVEDDRCRAALRSPGVLTVWLRASLATLVARYNADPHRPRYPEGTEAALRAQLHARAGHFANVSQAAIDVDRLSAAQVAARVAALVDAPGALTDPQRLH